MPKRCPPKSSRKQGNKFRTRPTLEPTGGVRATFAQGGSIQAQLENWSADGVVVRSPEFGRAKFNPFLFVALRFLREEGN